MNKPDDVERASEGDLEGLPGIGAVRRAALAVAGITTRAALAKATVEQLISITGMQRAYAIKALDAARAGSDTSLPPTAAGKPATGEVRDQHSAAIEPPTPDPESSLDLAGSVARTTTAVSDVSRLAPKKSDLARELFRFAKLLDRLVAWSQSLSEKKKTRVAVRLDRAVARLEKASLRGGKWSDSAAQRLRDRLKADREWIVETLPTKPRRKSQAKK